MPEPYLFFYPAPLHQTFSSITVIVSKTNTYRQISNIIRTLVGNKIVDHSDVVGAAPVGAAPTTSSFLT